MNSLTENFIDNLGSPIFIAICAMLALISLRNIHLSDRFRQVVDKCEKNNNSNEEYLNQAKKFKKRYESTGYAFSSLMIVLIVSILIELVGKVNIFTQTLLVVWSLCFLYSIFLIAKELIEGRDTLELEWERANSSK